VEGDKSEKHSAAFWVVTRVVLKVEGDKSEKHSVAFWVVTRVVLKVEGDKSEKHSVAFSLLPCRRRQYEPLPIILKKIMYLNILSKEFT
jgi:hypothetical protein